MTQAPTPRGPLGQLIEDAKKRSGKNWRTVESESGIPLSSIQAWVSGRSGEPALRGLLHLARYLKIPAENLADKALEGYEPPLKAMNGAASASGQEAARSEASDEAAVAGDARAASRQPRSKRRGSTRRPES